MSSKRIVSWTLLTVAIVFAAFVRYRLASMPLERDEGEYAYAGQLLLHGVPPYKLAYNMKLPGAYIAYAAIMAVFGQTMEAIRYGMLIINIATILVLYQLTRDQFDETTAGESAIIYAILSISGSVVGMNAHATHFVAFFGLAGATSLWFYLKSPAWQLAFLSGLLFCLAFLMKQQGLFLVVMGGIYLFARVFWCKERPWIQSLRDVFVFALAAAMPYLVVPEKRPC